MKKPIIVLSFVFLIFTGLASAQKKQDDKKAIPINQLLEVDAKRHLNIAWQYFKLRKAYKAVLMRTEETLAAHPTFSKIDELLYLSGMSSYYLSIGKGKQKLNFENLTKYEKERFVSPEKLKEDAIAFLGTLVEEHPKSKYRKKAEKTLKLLQPKEES